MGKKPHAFDGKIEMYISYDRLPGTHETANYYAVVNGESVFASYAGERTATRSVWVSRRADYWIRQLEVRALDTRSYPNFKRSAHDCPILYDLIAKIEKGKWSGQKTT